MKQFEDLWRELLSIREVRTLEVKKGLGESAMETVSAFSNEPGMGGGHLVFGVSEVDEDFAVVGVSNTEKLTLDLTNWCNSQKLNVAIRPVITTELFEGKKVVVAFIPEAAASLKPVYIKKQGVPKGAYRRISSADVKCTDEDIREFHRLAHNRKYEDSLALDATMADLDESAIAIYRKTLLENNPATETNDLDNCELIESIGAARKNVEGSLQPTVAAILLFGKASAIRRLYPMHRIDYIRVPSTKWMATDDYTTIDIRQPLLKSFRRVYDATIGDLPKAVAIPDGSPDRVDTPTVPGRVIREAIVNALCHRDYSTQSPVQVILFSNRIEIRNPGYSLSGDAELGAAGSNSRNGRIADVFRELGWAENKGTGIRVMRREMEQAKLAKPLFNSDRDGNRFVTKLLFSDLISNAHRIWLDSLGTPELTIQQQLALAYCREAGKVTNGVVRDLCDLDTLASSKVLISLRDMGVLEKKGASVGTFYVIKEQRNIGVWDEELGGQGKLFPDSPTSRLQPKTGDLHPKTGDLQPKTGDPQPKTTDLQAETGDLQPKTANLQSETGDLQVKTGNLQPTNDGTYEYPLSPSAAALFHSLPSNLRQRLARKIPRGHTFRSLVEEICRGRECAPKDLAQLLRRRNVKHLVSKHLSQMVEAGTLKRVHETINHPAQRYTTISSQTDQLT